MAKEQTGLDILIEVIGKNTSLFKKIQEDVKKLGEAAKTAGKAAIDSVKGGFDKFKDAAVSAGKAAGVTGGQLGKLASIASSLAPQIMIAVIAFYALVKIVTALTNFIKDSIPEFTEYQAVMMGLSSTSAAFGQSQSEARNAAQELAKDGLISVTTAANALKSLLSTGLNLDKAIDLIGAYKDEAAFGKASTIEYDDAVRNLAESFKTENAMIGNLSGQVENYNYIIEIGALMLGKKTSELTRAERVEAKYLGTLEVAAKAHGDAARYAKTYQGQVAKLNMVTKELRIEMGSYLVPAMEALTKWKLRLAEEAKNLSWVMRGVAKAILLVTVGAVQATNALRGLWEMSVAVGKSLATLSFEPIKDAASKTFDEITSTIIDFGEAWEEINNTTLEDISRDAGAGLSDLEDLTSDTAEKMAEAWERYQHSVEQAVHSYEQNLEDLVIAHRDTWEKIKEDIEDEERVYEENLEDLAKRFAETMEDLEERHGKKTASILKDIKAEKDAMQDEIDDISSEWNALITLTEQAGAIRLSNLQRQLAKEVALGDSADQDKISALEDYIAAEEEALQVTADEQKDARDTEIDEVKSATDEKIAELELELATVKTAYEESIRDKKLVYEEDVANYKEAQNERIDTLKEKLAEEESIRKRYADAFNEVGNKQAEDNIARLMRSHQEQLEELDYQYEKTIEGIREMETEKTNIIEEAEGKQQEAIKKTNDELKKGIDLMGYYFGGAGMYTSTEKPKSMKDDPLLFPPWMSGLQHGGIVSKPSIVGEKNYPEAVLPLGEPNRVDQILKSLGLGGKGKGEVVQNFYVTVNRESDVDMLMEKAAFNMKYK